MAGLAPEGSQFDGKQYDAKMNELLLQADGEEFFTYYDEDFYSLDIMGPHLIYEDSDSFDAMGPEGNLLSDDIYEVCDSFDTVEEKVTNHENDREKESDKDQKINMHPIDEKDIENESHKIKESTNAS